ncbi:hypothetical protein SLS62_006870 [Diatrype stigma]|uniref:Uncharacterized protein n=1 Tax=Diatrype stigma TaxID=117547 RepID=A0AAN9UQ90_9PEZI
MAVWLMDRTAAALSTVYFIILVINRFRGDRLNSRFFVAFRDSANTFLDALLIFTCSILASTVYRYAAFDLHQKHDDLDPDSFSSYQLMGAVALSVFCVFPCIVLQTVSGGLRVRTDSGKRRIRALRLLLWIIVVALTITVEVQYRSVYPQVWDNINNITFSSIREHAGLYREFWWTSNCDDLGLLQMIIVAVHAGHIILGIQLIWLLYSVVVSAMAAWLPHGRESPFERLKAYRIRSQSLNEHWKRWRPFVRLANGVMCVAMLNHLRDVASETSLDGKWTFGQVLSLFTWVPVVLEWTVILFCKFD